MSEVKFLCISVQCVIRSAVSLCHDMAIVWLCNLFNICIYVIKLRIENLLLLMYWSIFIQYKTFEMYVNVNFYYFNYTLSIYSCIVNVYFKQASLKNTLEISAP